jgi:membrane protein required for colicin V production
VTLDLVLLGLVLFFALWGALTGAARQIAQALAGLAAWFAARPAGDQFGAAAARQLNSSLVVGTVCVTFATFLLVFLLVRWLFTAALRRLLAGTDPKNRTADRAFGFFLGGTKIAALTWVVVCALSFVEDNVTLQGRKFGLVPKDSITFKLAREHNLFELSQFSGVEDVLRVARLQADSKKQPKLKENLDFQVVAKDPRFLAVLDSPELKRVLGGGDTRSLLQNNQLLQLLQDPLAMKRISRIVQSSDQ